MTEVVEDVKKRIVDLEEELTRVDSNDILSIQLIEADLEKLEKNLVFAEDRKIR